MDCPPSPALSFCDTLSSPDLDAYLDSLGPLSQHPSPEMKEAWWIQEELFKTTRQDSMFSEVQTSYETNAEILCSVSQCHSCSAVKSLPAMITQFLNNSGLPLETIAIAYNILNHAQVSPLHCWHGDAVAFASPCMSAKMLAIHGPLSDASCQRALIILSALNLAVSYTEERTRPLSSWSKQVAGGAFSAEQIGLMNRLLLSQVDWALHPLAAPSAVDAAISCLSNREPSTPADARPASDYLAGGRESLRSLMTPQTTLQYGLITPEPSPGCCSTFDETGRASYL